MTALLHRLAARPLFQLALIGLVGVIAYANSFHVPFIFDDVPNIVENPMVQDLRYFSDPSLASGHPFSDAFKSRFIGYLTFALNYRLHGLNVEGYHAFNIAVHLLNAMLLWQIVLLTFRTPALAEQGTDVQPAHVALAAALLFVAHPVQTQAVTYIVQRFASLAALFCLLSLVLYVRGRLAAQRGDLGDEHPPARRFGASALFLAAAVVSAALAMKTKEISLTLPLAIALYEFLFFRGQIGGRVLRLLPFFLLSALAIPLIFFSPDSTLSDLLSDLGRATRVDSELPRWSYLMTQARVLVTYLRLLMLPIGQNVDYDYPVHHSLFDPPVLLSVLLLTSLFAGAIALVRASRGHRAALRIPAFGIFWFFIMLAVESSVIPIADVIFEHRLYLPSAGLFIAAASGAAIFVARVRASLPAAPRIAGAVLAALVIVLTGATIARNTLWQDEIRLWEDGVRKSPSKARPYCSLAAAYADAGQTSKAIELYTVALALQPEYADARNNRGNAYAALGRHHEAIADFSEAILQQPRFAEAYNNRGNVYFDLGQYALAIEDYTRSLAINPGSHEVYNNRGNSYDESGRPDLAIEDYGRAIALNARFAEAYYNRGIAHARAGRISTARSDFVTACGLGHEESCAFAKELAVR